MLKYALLTLVFLIISYQGVKCQLSILTPSIVAMLGDNVTIKAEFRGSVVTTSLVNWYLNQTVLTTSGTLSASSSKYSITNNGSYFTLTIFKLSSSDLNTYYCIYANPPTTIQSVNANITQFNVTTVKQTTNCETTSSVTAVFTLVLLAYLLLVVVSALLFVMTRTQREKVSCSSLCCLLFFIQLSVASITAMIIIWLTSYSVSQTLSYLIASIFGLIGYLSIWIGILYLLFIFVQEENLFSVHSFSAFLIALTQIGFLIGIIICVTHCGNFNTFASLTIDYGNLGVIFSCIIVTLNIYLLIWSIIFTIFKDARNFAINLSRKPVDGVKLDENKAQSNLNAGTKSTKPTAFDKIYVRLPRSLQKFIDSARRCFKRAPKESKDITSEFKNISSPTESSRGDAKNIKGKPGALTSRTTNRSVTDIAKGGKVADMSQKGKVSDVKGQKKEPTSKNATQPTIGEKSRSFVKDPKTNQLVAKDAAKKQNNDGKESKMSKAATNKKDSKSKDDKKKNNKKSKKKDSDDDSDASEAEEEENEENEDENDDDDGDDKDEDDNNDNDDKEDNDDDDEDEEKNSDDDDDDDSDDSDAENKKKKGKSKQKSKSNAKSKSKKK